MDINGDECNQKFVSGEALDCDEGVITRNIEATFVDLKQPIMTKWSVTRKRSCSGGVPSVKFRQYSEKQPNDLQYCVPTKKQRVVGDPILSPDFEEEDMLMLLAKVAIPLSEATIEKGEEEIQENGDAIMELSVAESSAAIIPVNDNTNEEHRCDICGKTFGSGQALGGHKSSSHTKAVRKEYGSKKSSSSSTEEEEEESPGTDNGCQSKAAKVKGEHRCRTCNKSFNTGMALGGHMRLHYVQPINNVALLSLTSTQNQISSSSTLLSVAEERKPVHDFDLNEPVAPYHH